MTSSAPKAKSKTKGGGRKKNSQSIRSKFEPSLSFSLSLFLSLSLSFSLSLSLFLSLALPIKAFPIQSLPIKPLPIYAYIGNGCISPVSSQSWRANASNLPKKGTNIYFREGGRHSTAVAFTLRVRQPGFESRLRRFFPREKNSLSLMLPC